MNRWIIQRDANETGSRSNQTWSVLFPLMVMFGPQKKIL